MLKKILFLMLFTVLSLASYGQYFYHYGYYYARPRPVYYSRPSYSRSHTHQKVKVKHPRKQTINNDNSIVINVVKKEPKKIQVADRVIYEEEEVQPTQPIIVEERVQPTYSTDMWAETVWFREGYHIISENHQKITLENVIRFMQTHPYIRIKISGYASRNTGYYELNAKLARQRVESIFHYLTMNGISSDRIEADYENFYDHEYKSNDKWNQCVVINSI